MPTREQETWPAVQIIKGRNIAREMIYAVATRSIRGPSETYLPAQSIAPLVEALEMTLNSMLTDGIEGESDRDATTRIHCKWAVEKALSDFKAHTQPEESE